MLAAEIPKTSASSFTDKNLSGIGQRFLVVSRRSIARKILATVSALAGNLPLSKRETEACVIDNSAARSSWEIAASSRAGLSFFQFIFLPYPASAEIRSSKNLYSVASKRWASQHP